MEKYISTSKKPSEAISRRFSLGVSWSASASSSALVLAAAASLAVLPAYAAAGEKVQILPLLAVVAAAAALCALDIFAGRPLAQRMARRMKTVNIVLLAALVHCLTGCCVMSNPASGLMVTIITVKSSYIVTVPARW